VVSKYYGIAFIVALEQRRGGEGGVVVVVKEGGLRKRYCFVTFVFLLW
jgi:hypothetical protein